MRALNANTVSGFTGLVLRPIWFVDIMFTTPLYLSSREALTLDGVSYVNAGMTVDVAGRRVQLSNPNKTIFTVTAATNATPIVLTTSITHTVLAGETVQVLGVAGNTAANGIWVVQSVTTTTITLTGSVGSGAWTSGGTVGVYGGVYSAAFLAGAAGSDVVVRQAYGTPTQYDQTEIMLEGDTGAMTIGTTITFDIRERQMNKCPRTFARDPDFRFLPQPGSLVFTATGKYIFGEAE